MGMFDRRGLFAGVSDKEQYSEQLKIAKLLQKVYRLECELDRIENERGLALHKDPWPYVPSYINEEKFWFQTAKALVSMKDASAERKKEDAGRAIANARRAEREADHWARRTLDRAYSQLRQTTRKKRIGPIFLIHEAKRLATADGRTPEELEEITERRARAVSKRRAHDESLGNDSRP